MGQGQIHFETHIVGLPACFGRPMGDPQGAARRAAQPLELSPLEFMQPLTALVPRPRLNLIRFHGALAPNARIRSMITPGRTLIDKDSAEDPDRASHHCTAGRMNWAR